MAERPLLLPRMALTKEGIMQAFTFNRRLADGSVYRLGTAVEYPDGWQEGCHRSQSHG
jgi:hypothetical protein